MTTLIKYFDTATEITGLINAYFASVGIEEAITPRPPKNKLVQYNPEKLKLISKPVIVKPKGAKYDPPTLSGLALFLGFESLDALDLYEIRGRYSTYLKRARLRIMAEYEKKLHNSNPSGAIFALKGLGRNTDKNEEKTTSQTSSILEVKIIETGPALAAEEKEVIL